MLTIQNHQLLEKKITGWRPTDLVFIKSIRHYYNEIDNKWMIEILAFFQQRVREKSWPDFEGRFVGVDMTFQDVFQSDIKLPEFTPIQFTGFDIIDVSDEKINGAKFLIEDYENGNINFYCNAIVIVRVEDSRHLAHEELFTED